MKKPRLEKTMLRYIISYVSIALLSCLLVGVVLFSMSVNELNAAHKATQYERLEIAANLVEDNMELMQEAAYKLQSQFIFRTSYLKENGYNPAIMLSYLSNFRNYVPLTSEFFLIYKDHDIVYKVSNDNIATNNFALYMNVLLRSDTPEFYKTVNGNSEKLTFIDSLYKEINETEKFLLIPVEDSSSALFCYPIQFSDSSSDRAVLCFVVYDYLIWEQVYATIGKTDTKFGVYYDDMLIASQYEPSIDNLSEISSRSTDGHINFALIAEDSIEFEGVNKFRILCNAFILSMAFLMILIAIYAAWRNYRPLKELAQRYELVSDKVYTNDALSQLSATLDQMFDNNRISTERLQNEIVKLNEQRETICHQLVQALICGQLDSYPRKYMQYLDRNAEEKLYGVLTVKPYQDGVNSIPVSVDAVIKLIEGLSDEMQSIHGLALSNTDSAVFLCFINTKEDMDIIRELAEAVCDEQDIQIKCGIGLVCDSYARIPSSFIYALSSMEETSEAIMGETNSSNRFIERLVTEAKNANYSKAMMCLSEIFNQLPKNASYLLKISTSLKVIGALVQVAHDSNVAIIEDRINLFAILQNQDEFMTITGELIARICDEVSQKRNQQYVELSSQIVVYIREHVSDYNLDVSNIGEQFSIPARQVSKLVREATGLSYKEYLNSVRVELACKLLTVENLSVQETCERVGLSEVSYFIRIFKSISGETPLNYKKKHMCDNAAIIELKTFSN